MEFNRLPFLEKAMSNAQVYTNLQGLQSIKLEKDRDQALKQVAQQFESLFVNMMTKSMRAANAVFEENSPFSSREARFYRDMLDQQRALSLAHGKGLGIAEAMYRQMSRSYGNDSFRTENSSRLSIPSPQHFDSDTPHRQLPIVEIKKPNQGLLDTPRQRHSVGKDAEGESFASSPLEFIEKVLPYAKKAAEVLGVDHLILVAQSALETGWGKHVLSTGSGKSSFNLFNIKSSGAWQANTIHHATLEYTNGVFKKERAEFRAYASAAESFDDYVDFISGNQRYEQAIASANDPVGFIQQLHQAGYATDPDYSDKVLSVYERINALVEELPRLSVEYERDRP